MMDNFNLAKQQVAEMQDGLKGWMRDFNTMYGDFDILDESDLDETQRQHHGNLDMTMNRNLIKLQSVDQKTMARGAYLDPIDDGLLDMMRTLINWEKITVNYPSGLAKMIIKAQSCSSVEKNYRGTKIRVSSNSIMFIDGNGSVQYCHKF